MANALKRGPLVQLLKSLFTGGTDETTMTPTGSYSMRFPDVGDAVEGVQSYVHTQLSKFDQNSNNGSWLSHFLESVVVIGLATALVVVYRDEQKWAKVVSLFSLGTTTNATSEDGKVRYPFLPPLGIYPSYSLIPNTIILMPITSLTVSHIQLLPCSLPFFNCYSTLPPPLPLPCRCPQTLRWWVPSPVT